MAQNLKLILSFLNVADLKGYPPISSLAYWGLRNNKRSQQRMLAVISLLHSNIFMMLTYIYHEAQKQITATKSNE